MISLENCRFFYVTYPPITGGNHVANLLSTHDKFFPRFNSKNYPESLKNVYLDKLNSNLTTEHWDIVKSTLEKHTDIQLSEKFSDALSAVHYNAHVYKWSFEDIKFNTGMVEDKTDDLVELHAMHYTMLCNAAHHINDYFKKIYICTSHNPMAVAKQRPRVHNDFLQAMYENINSGKNLAGIICTKAKKGRAMKRLFANRVTFKEISKNTYDMPLCINDKPIFTTENSFYLNSDKFLENKGSYYFQETIYENLGIELPNEIHEIHDIWIEMIDKSISLV